MSAPVHVAGTGVISAIGNSTTECFNALQQRIPGIGPLTSLNSIYKDILPVGEVKLTNDQLAEKIGVDKTLNRTAMLGIHAAREAIVHAEFDIHRWRTGLISATTVGGMDKSEVFFSPFLQDPTQGKLRDVIYHGCGATTELITSALGISGYSTTINTACSSSVNSIILGTRLIQHGMLDVVVAGGTDALTMFTLNGFKSLMILDDKLCRPYDAARNGLNLGEGAGFVVLVSDKVLQEEDLESLAIVAGYANTNDAFHQTASSPEGRGSFAAMEQALSMADLLPSDIDYINLHGTGTQNNDLSEGTAIKRLFGDAYPALSSTKTFTGHTLGACGGIEAVFTVLALQHQCVFPNLRFENAIPEVGIIPQKKFESIAVRHAMSNSFGFGGNCSSIIFSQGR